MAVNEERSVNPFSNSGLWPEDMDEGRAQAEAELASALEAGDEEHANLMRDVLRLVNEDIRSRDLHAAESANYQRSAGTDTISDNETSADDEPQE